MDIILILSFLFFMSIFAGVGMASMFVKEDTTDDYLVAGRGMNPALAALSAVSTWNSGYMFIGFIGFTYMMGYSVLWLGLVSTVGQVLAWVWLYKFIQEEGQERGLRSLSSLVAEKAGAPEAKLAAALSVLFLSIYAAAQLTSGGKALFVMMGWPEMVGILIGFVLVVAYCYAGGIRASIWTDAVQSCVMVIGSTILCWIAVKEVGGFSGLHAGLAAQSPMLTNTLPPDLKFGISLWAFAFFLGGLGVAGQPQVVSRVMTLGSDSDRKKAMIWFFVWQTPFIVLMLIIGLACRVLFTDVGFDAELGLPTMAMETMPAIGVGMILASIFAATMSTADSQVLACTAAITDDIKPEWREDHKTTKKVTLVVAAFATLISIGGLYIPGGDSVFLLVVLAVYGLGGIFIPLLTIRWMGYKPDSTHSISMMVAAFAGVIGWLLLGFGGADGIFPSVPGMGAAFAVHFILNQVRTPEVSSLGRYNWPEQKKLGAIAAAILIPFCVFEASYLVGAPDSSDAMGGVGNYTVVVQSESVWLGWTEDYIDDEDTLEIIYTWNPVMGNSESEFSDGFEVRTIRFGWEWEETDESTDPNGPIQQASCAVDPGDDELDSTWGRFSHRDWDSEEQQGTPNGQIWGDGEISQWFIETLASGWAGEYGQNWTSNSSNGNTTYHFSNFSEKTLHEKFTPNGDHTGDHSMSIRLEAEVGGNSNCPHSDDGDDVTWNIEIVAHKFTIEPAT